MVSRQCAGVSLPDRATVQKFTQALSDTQSIPLVVAYLQDHCPVPLRSKVSIRARMAVPKTRPGEGLKLDLARFPPPQRTLIRQFVDIVVADPRATAFLSAALKFIGPQDSSKQKQ